MQRKMLAARADLADKVYEIAMRKGTLYDFVNDILEQAVRADAMGLTLREVVDERWILKDARDAGFIVFPERLVYGLIEKACKTPKRELQSLWYETGEWYGKYFADPKRFGEVMSRLLWDASEFRISKEDKDALRLTCLSSKFSESHTDLFGKFLEGAFNALGYEKESGEFFKGIINLRFKKKGG
ncbi:MAG: hypothetical protein ACUVV4_04765 [Candidatus Bathyarchaeia archaeon]